jgi:hypothetical protein
VLAMACGESSGSPRWATAAGAAALNHDFLPVALQ